MHLVFAYIDPGAGSLVIQAIIAGIVSIPFFFRNAIRKTFGRFQRKPDDGAAVATGSSAPEDKGAATTDSE
ncbi:MAG: hypothetical protein ACXWL8_04990 [Candidatus Limnocylindria bacterium]